MSAHFFGRKKNCYSIAIRYVHRALRYAVRGRVLRKYENRELWDTRLSAGCQELGTSYTDMKSVLNEAGIALDRKTMQNMAIWEPRSFRALALLTKAKQAEMGLNSLDGPPAAGVITRGML